MISTSRLRGAVVAAVVAPLALTTVGAAPAHSASAVAPTDGDLATTWIEGQLTNGVLHNQQYDFDDVGLTIDAALLANADARSATVAAIANGVAGKVDSYVKYVDGTTTYTYGGQTAKAAVLAQIAGRDPNGYGGQPLTTELAGLTDTSGSNAGEVQNRTEVQGGATTNAPVNTISQALASRALAQASNAQAGPARGFLLLQQCNDGGFRAAPNADETAADQSCGAGAGDLDSTSLTVLQLQAQKSTPAVGAALTKAAAWLAGKQQADGSFANDQGANANTTGLAGAALAAQGNGAAATKAATWVRGLQVQPCTTGALATHVGAIAFNPAALATARTAGITAITSDQFRRATAQAGLGLVAVPTQAPVCAQNALTASLAKRKVHRKKKQSVTVTGFASGEQVTVRYKKKRRYVGTADINGIYTVVFKVGKKLGKFPVRAYSATHATKVKFKVVR